jgi:hypothetical protein
MGWLKCSKSGIYKIGRGFERFCFLFFFDNGPVTVGSGFWNSFFSFGAFSVGDTF